MSAEPENTPEGTPEPAAAAVAEPAVDVAEATPAEPEAPAADAPAEDVGLFADILDRTKEIGLFADLPTGEDAAQFKSVVKSLSAQQLQSLDPVSKTFLRAAAMELEAGRKKLADAESASKTALAKEKADLATERAAFRRQQEAFYALANSKAMAGVDAVIAGADKADPTTAEGQRLIAAAEAQKAARQFFEPIQKEAASHAQRVAEEQREANYNQILAANPEMTDAAFQADVAKLLNEWQDAGRPVAGELQNAIDIVRGRRAQAGARDRQTRATAARAVAASHLGRSTTGAAPHVDASAIPATYKGQSTKDLQVRAQFLRDNPQAQRAVIADYFTPR